jgi:flagella basal body P-ring formation protein FlgA
LAAIAMLAAAGSALAFAVLYLNAGNRRPVLAVTAPVPAGATIQAADLTVVQISVDPQLAPLPATEQSTVVGQPAAADLLPGTLLTRAHVGAASPVQPGQAMVGLALQSGAVPSPQLRAGDLVQVIETLPARYRAPLKLSPLECGGCCLRDAGSIDRL